MVWLQKEMLENISVKAHIFPSSFPSLLTLGIASCKRIQDSLGF